MNHVDSPSLQQKVELHAKPDLDNLALKNDEMNLLKANLKDQLNEAASEISTGQANEEDMTSRLSQLELDLEESRANEVKLKEKLKWRKAADVATTVLVGGMEMNGERRISERCGSMDKQFGSKGEGIFGVRNDGRK
ncbi:hypothetical protein ACSBR1_014498 [Camellia fascicularis]